MPGHSWSIVVCMTKALPVLLLSVALLADAGAEDQPVPETVAPNPAGEQVPAPAPAAVPATRPSVPARILPIDQRMEAYDQFRAMYETARFDEALPLAQRVVELSETDRDRDIELPIAHSNLGATQYQLNNYPAAEVSYQTSLELLESTQGISSRRMIVPLAGLGTVYAAQDQHALAVPQFDRALAISRRADGLFNLAQLPLIAQVADSRFALGDFGGVEREYYYAIKIAEHHYGFDDPRTLPAVLRLAAFYESVREFIGARMLYLRARDISMKESGGFNPLAIKCLVGIGRTYRMQYTIDPDALEGQGPARDKTAGEVVSRIYQESRVSPPAADRAGLRSVQTALELLRATPDPPPQLLTEVLTELGDWYQATSRPNIALPYYAEASALYTAETESGLVNPLLAPRMIFYRPPTASTRGLNTPTDQYLVRKTVFSFVVSETGETRDFTVVSSDMSEGQLAQSRRALDRAIYSPRFENGAPVATDGVRFTSDWYEQKPLETPSTAGG